MRSQPRSAFVKWKYVLSFAPRPAVRVDAAARRAEPVRLRELDQPPLPQAGLRRALVAVRLRDRAGEVDARPVLDRVVVDAAGIVRREAPVDPAVGRDVRRAARARADERRVEAVDRHDRAVPELEQPLGALVGDALRRGRASACRARRRRPRCTDDAGSRRSSRAIETFPAAAEISPVTFQARMPTASTAATAVAGCAEPAQRREQRRAATPPSEDADQQPLRARRRPLVVAVRLLEDREAERVRVELHAHLERRADDEIEAVGGRRPRARPRLTRRRSKTSAVADEEERRDVDEVALLDSRRERPTGGTPPSCPCRARSR